MIEQLNLNCHSSDETLILAAGRGDTRAFSEVVRRHQQWAWQIAHRFCGDEHEAADIVQEAFLNVFAASGRYKSQAKFRTYFYRIITHICIDKARKKSPDFMANIPEFTEKGKSAAEFMEHEETARTVRKALDGLCPAQRLAVIFRYYEELSYKEIAAVLSTTPKAVEGLLTRARQHLKTSLVSKIYFEGD